MKILETRIPQVLCVAPNVLSDDRGTFVKVFHENSFRQSGIALGVGEIFFSTSHKNVLRGFHFQNPPVGLAKLVWVAQGEILDVVIDLRKDSPTFGQCHEQILSSKNSLALYMPEGTGHAFLCLSDECYVVYCASRVFDPKADAGLRWDSTAYQWPIADPILSAKDRSLPAFDEWESPF